MDALKERIQKKGASVYDLYELLRPAATKCAHKPISVAVRTGSPDCPDFQYGKIIGGKESRDNGILSGTFVLEVDVMDKPAAEKPTPPPKPGEEGSLEEAKKIIGSLLSEINGGILGEENRTALLTIAEAFIRIPRKKDKPAADCGPIDIPDPEEDNDISAEIKADFIEKSGWKTELKMIKTYFPSDWKRIEKTIMAAIWEMEEIVENAVREFIQARILDMVTENQKAKKETILWKRERRQRMMISLLDALGYMDSPHERGCGIRRRGIRWIPFFINRYFPFADKIKYGFKEEKK